MKLKMLKSYKFWILLAFIVVVAIFGSSVEEPNIWILAAFLCFFGLFGVTAFKKAVGVLDARSERIRQEIDDAQKLREEAQALLAEYRKNREAAEAQALEMVEFARVEAGRKAEQAKKDLEAAMQRRAELALGRIAQAEADALRDVRRAAATLAVQVTAALLQGAMDAKRADTMIEESIRQVREKLH
jgi:F-type H+-transporting ATPase subunit b